LRVKEQETRPTLQEHDDDDDDDDKCMFPYYYKIKFCVWKKKRDKRKKDVEFEEGKEERTEEKNKKAIGDKEGKIKLETKREQGRETTERTGRYIVHVFLIVFLHR